jgi:aspartyl-tRNA(Asn)/glutamyl-tRNA(Gln) amidotransferase subunit A
LIKNDFDKVFEDVDLLVTPVSPTVAFKFGEKSEDPLAMYLSDILTVPVNPAGLPAISIPAGFVEGMPVGLQLIGPMWSEEKILNTAHAFQKATDYHKKKPKII